MHDWDIMLCNRNGHIVTDYVLQLKKPRFCEIPSEEDEGLGTEAGRKCVQTAQQIRIRKEDPNTTVRPL